MSNPTITVEIEYRGEYVVLGDAVEDALQDICDDADVDPTVEDNGRGPYEYWGSRGFDVRLEVTAVEGCVDIDVDYSVSLSESDQERVDAGEDEDEIRQAAIEEALDSFSWPGIGTSGCVEGRKRDVEYNVSWFCRAATTTTLTYEAEMG